MNVEVRVLDRRIFEWGFPSYGSADAAGMDLFACIDEPVILEPGSPAQLIPSGLAIRIGDRDWCGLVLPRSGLGHRQGLVLGNTAGVIDPDYSGPCLVSAWNRSVPPAAAITVNPGDRIAQLLLVRVAHPTFVVVDTFTASSARGAGGFGSTGQSPIKISQSPE
jgi:dUTP pyrophosphatase